MSQTHQLQLYHLPFFIVPGTGNNRFGHFKTRLGFILWSLFMNYSLITPPDPHDYHHPLSPPGSYQRQHHLWKRYSTRRPTEQKFFTYAHTVWSHNGISLSFFFFLLFFLFFFFFFVRIFYGDRACLRCSNMKRILLSLSRSFAYETIFYFPTSPPLGPLRQSCTLFYCTPLWTSISIRVWCFKLPRLWLTVTSTLLMAY